MSGTDWEVRMGTSEPIMMRASWLLAAMIWGEARMVTFPWEARRLMRPFSLFKVSVATKVRAPGGAEGGGGRGHDRYPGKGGRNRGACRRGRRHQDPAGSGGGARGRAGCGRGRGLTQEELDAVLEFIGEGHFGHQHLVQNLPGHDVQFFEDPGDDVPFVGRGHHHQEVVFLIGNDAHPLLGGRPRGPGPGHGPLLQGGRARRLSAGGALRLEPASPGAAQPGGAQASQAGGLLAAAHGSAQAPSAAHASGAAKG